MNSKQNNIPHLAVQCTTLCLKSRFGAVTLRPVQLGRFVYNVHLTPYKPHSDIQDYNTGFSIIRTIQFRPLAGTSITQPYGPQ